MARARYLDSLSADNAHLPTVSVFIVLLAMMSALIAQTNPSSGNFKAAKLSLIESFAAKTDKNAPQHLALPAPVLEQARALCTSYEAKCLDVTSSHMDAIAMTFSNDQFRPGVSGVTVTEDKFLKVLSSLLVERDVALALLPASNQSFNNADSFVLLDLIARFSKGEAKLSVLSAPGLEREGKLGFLIYPAAGTL